VGRLEERGRDAVEADVIFFGQVSEALKLVDGGVEMACDGLRVSADALDAIAGEVGHVLLGGGGTLAA